CSPVALRSARLLTRTRDPHHVRNGAIMPFSAPEPARPPLRSLTFSCAWFCVNACRNRRARIRCGPHRPGLVLAPGCDTVPGDHGGATGAPPHAGPEGETCGSTNVSTDT